MSLRGATSLTGAAGEHHVMSRLLANGFIAALAPQGVPTMDIVVTSVDGSSLCGIQVKTRWDKGGDGGWHMSKKHENPLSDRIFFCFVDLGKSAADNPTTYVVPANVVATVVRDSHAAWLATPGRGGRQRKDSTMRRFLPDHRVYMGENSPYPEGWLAPYKENWRSLMADNHMTGFENV